MESIWADGTLQASFREQFRELAARTNGSIENDTATTIFCAFEPTGHRSAMRVGIYYASGRNTFRFDTTREEIELAMMSEFEIGDSRLVIASEKGSRHFELDVATGEWAVVRETL